MTEPKPRRTRKPDDLRFYDALRPLKVSRDGPYKSIDRYRDFVSVFSSDAGKRVLSQIVDHCEGKVPSEDESDAKVRAYIARRRVGWWICAQMMAPAQVEIEQKPIGD